ncbi:uncharacterized protein (TIGR01777 family) [Allocatelliglobosispora scoriae]|uniref:Uncharacterized protein (TIGR01777 family) n=1 Tax=Allocatelliglobosispora scoriae TaxID=643052 RepID=A0A841BQP5_9ACTN|nr:TIGR01777 family oxidoreductase [Allocatelliglobosispora scoriae]MBB5869509.1 uncharacterized protein (TIGR01777 family) [Allocatelliglobosispora scoriae]
MRIVVAGSSGFLGTKLVGTLRADGHEITRLVRRPATTPTEASWDPEAGRLDASVLDGADAIVNLGGVGVADKRWTDSYRRELRTSRIVPTSLLAMTLATMPADRRPKVLINSSAVGFYGDTGDTLVDEEAEPGDDFLAILSRDWETAARRAEMAGVRTVMLRTGFPLDPGGGLLKPLLLPFKLGVGGKIGNGGQYVPWISMVDWLNAVRFVLEHDEIAGPVNLVGPQPATNAEFTKALGEALHRPTFWRIPGLAMKVVAGDVAADMVASKRVLPKVLLNAGFTFQHETVREALAAVLP